MVWPFSDLLSLRGPVRQPFSQGRVGYWSLPIHHREVLQGFLATLTGGPDPPLRRPLLYPCPPLPAGPTHPRYLTRYPSSTAPLPTTTHRYPPLPTAGLTHLYPPSHPRVYADRATLPTTQPLPTSTPTLLHLLPHSILHPCRLPIHPYPPPCPPHTSPSAHRLPTAGPSPPLAHHRRGGGGGGGGGPTWLPVRPTRPLAGHRLGPTPAHPCPPSYPPLPTWLPTCSCPRSTATSTHPYSLLLTHLYPPLPTPTHLLPTSTHLYSHPYPPRPTMQYSILNT